MKQSIFNITTIRIMKEKWWKENIEKKEKNKRRIKMQPNKSSVEQKKSVRKQKPLVVFLLLKIIRVQTTTA